MKYHKEFKTAFRYAALKHKNQKRKGSDLPYIVHPYDVAMKLISLCAQKDVIIAGFLHDVLEDTDTTIDELSANFGSKIAYIVREVTKGTYLYQLSIEEYSPHAVQVKIADLSCNVTDILEDYNQKGDAVFKIFKNGHKAISDYYEVALLLDKKSKSMPLFNREIKKVLTRLKSLM